MMCGGDFRSHHIFDPQMQINAVTSVRQDEASSHRVHRYVTSGTVEMNVGDTNNYTGFAGRNWVLLYPTHRMSYIFGFNLVDGKSTLEEVKIKTCETSYE